MKKAFLSICVLLFFMVCLRGAMHAAELAAEKALEERRQQTAVTAETLSAPTFETAIPTEAPTTEATVPPTLPPETTLPEPATETTVPVLTFSEEEETLLLKIGMAERGTAGCTDCVALVMRTVLNRVESPKFSSTIKGVIYAQDQFTPVMDGTFEAAVPGERCRKALDMIKQGWDESQGALYYEWCEGESWHSRNLTLLFQHCDTRFYK